MVSLHDLPDVIGDSSLFYWSYCGWGRIHNIPIVYALRLFPAGYSLLGIAEEVLFRGFVQRGFERS